MVDTILSLIREHQRFFLITHIRPDGDALGSQLALGRFLEKLGKDVAMINSDEPPYNLDWLPGAEQVEVYDGALHQREALLEADVVFVLDTNDAERIGHLGSTVKNADAVKVLVDHHMEPETWFDVPFVRNTASSTGALVYEIIEAHDASLIDEAIATALYTAIMTDTGSFRYSHVTPGLHRAVADILERGGIDPAPIHENIYDRRSMSALRLLGRMLNRIRTRYNGQVAYSVVTQRMVDDTGASWDDKDGFVNYILSIDGVKAALLFSEVSDGAKISFRSEAGTRVDEWARSFDGGGHRNASGAYVRRPTFEDVINDVMDAAERYLDLDPAHATGEGLTSEDASYLETMMKARSEGNDGSK